MSLLITVNQIWQRITGVLQEQISIPVNITAISSSETDFLYLNGTSTHYLVRNVILKCADPGADYVAVNLYQLVSNVLTLVDTFIITGSGDLSESNYDTYFNLMDMFGEPHIACDIIRISVQTSAGGPYAITGQYNYSESSS